ncbi:MAG: hypothetical protein LBR57_00220 [Alistipes sp.]|jgi:hypothetical protein|nr:hypothetical protein [Alistipes sp.]
MMNELIYIEEPKILFAHNQKLEDPRDGLTLFGPIEEGRPYGIMSGVVATKEGFRKFKEYIKSLQSPIYNKDNKTRPFFPGFETAFKSHWDTERILFKEISDSEIGQYLYYQDNHERTYKIVNLYKDKIVDAIKNEDQKADIWFIIIPDEVYQYCRPQSTIPQDNITVKRHMTRKRALEFTHSKSLFDDVNDDAEPFKYDAHFHNQFKSRLLQYEVPSQILRESTLDWRSYVKSNGAYKRDFSKIEGHLAWSISTAAFFKAGGKPWKLSDVRKGVCYIGLVYKQDEREKNARNACCAAQMFLDSGDGTVFRGAVGPWYNLKNREFHLDKKQAKALIGVAVKSYREKEGAYPQELFIHAKTRFNNAEWDGFVEAVPPETRLVGITIDTKKPLKIYRPDSNYPVMRGLAYIQNEKSAFLWTKGYVPRLETSLAMEIPNPLFIEINKGESEISTVLADILALTKLNYNACVYGDGIPVTLRFADAIGEILTAGPKENLPPLAFKYYI